MLYLVVNHAGIVSLVESELHLPDEEPEAAFEPTVIGF
jgi:hypothetical protein